MIYTVTLNPSIDYLVEVESFQMGKVNRTSYDAKFPGGKGINVSRVLKRLGNSTTALGFIGGQTGEFVKRFLRQEEIFTDFTEIAGDTRINIKLKTGLETEINSQGPVISKGNYQQLFSQIEQLNNNDILILSGSIPPSVPSDVYEAMSRSCIRNGIKVVVDTSGKELLNVLPHRPFLIKPNHHELGELFSTEISTVDDAREYGAKLVEAGAQNVIVSMAGQGAVLCSGGESYSANVPKGNVINSVGAGDSMVAGFIGTYERTGDILSAFRFSLAAGSATAFSSDLGTLDKIEELLPQIAINQLTGG
ncbi:1-phosphofructokinase [Peribacillus castrilensis]|uniref:Tagatose-6-phosphate kinase n=1 Tax=Peribacillus frigoritolerans TaxID=450367 RepID=A0AAJ1QP36_9BACI|nr:1-phosphofructokinase [Peribacillus frigoritolerans]MDM5284883.1 1-phosphofructokinase [Peribacillus frigoritolerans]USK62855.1 1-phosphofructokinase [Peribacillus frigoritolerans]